MRGAAAPEGPPPGPLRLDAGGYQPLLGESFGEIAAPQPLHAQEPGLRHPAGPRVEPGVLPGPGGRAGDQGHLRGHRHHLGARTRAAPRSTALPPTLIARFDPQDPAGSVPALLDLRSRLAGLPGGPVVEDKRRQLDRILQGCLGLDVETSVAQAEVVPGETLTLRHDRDRPDRLPGALAQRASAPPSRSTGPASFETTRPCCRPARRSASPTGCARRARRACSASTTRL